jgi:acetolactate synthase-1/2/3 large subunit
MSKKIRVADFIANMCNAAGSEHVFLVTGGGAMHLNDAFGRHKGFTAVCFHHEQGAAIAAEAYYRTSNKVATLNVTTGPGGINALNGVYQLECLLSLVKSKERHMLAIAPYLCGSLATKK